MSRIGRKPIIIPEEVEVNLTGNELIVSGPKGKLSVKIPHKLKVNVGRDSLKIAPRKTKQTKDVSMLWGLARAKIANAILGVKEGFEKQLLVEGVGFRADMLGKKLVLNLGHSHPIEIEKPEGVEFKVEKNVITVSGIDRELVGRVAASIRDLRKPEPYKGKGVRYKDEHIRRKVGKIAGGEEGEGGIKE